MEGLGRTVREADGDVGLALLEVDRARGRIDGDGHGRVAAVKSRERRHQPQPCEGGQGADAHHVAPLGETAEGRLQQLQRCPGLLMQPCALGAERHHTGGAVEQGGAQQLFQFADAVADRAVREVQVFGGLVEALAARHGIEGCDEVKGRDVAHGSPASYRRRCSGGRCSHFLQRVTPESCPSRTRHPIRSGQSSGQEYDGILTVPPPAGQPKDHRA